MNGQEQKDRQTAVAILERKFSKLEDATTDAWKVEVECRQQEDDKLRHDNEETISRLTQLVYEKIGAERDHRLKLAEQQRTYVDNQHTQIASAVYEFMSLPWWKRWVWCAFGSNGLRRVERFAHRLGSH